MRRLALIAVVGLLATGCQYNHTPPSSLYPGTAAPAASVDDLPPPGAPAGPIGSSLSATSSETAPVYTISALLDARAAGKLGSESVLVGGYWSERILGHSCAGPADPPGELEIYCHDGEWGITEQAEPIVTVTPDLRLIPAASPHLTPWLPNELAAKLSTPPDGTPASVTVRGHFDDPRAKACRPASVTTCRDRLVVDEVVAFDVSTAAKAMAAPPPTAFVPGPAPFGAADCAGTTPYSIEGWVKSADLGIDYALPEDVYAMVTRDAVPLGQWVEDSSGSAGKYRWWGRMICYARPGDVGIVAYAHVPGSSYQEWGDGRKVAGEAP